MDDVRKDIDVDLDVDTYARARTHTHTHTIGHLSAHLLHLRSANAAEAGGQCQAAEDAVAEGTDLVGPGHGLGFCAGVAQRVLIRSPAG